MSEEQKTLQQKMIDDLEEALDFAKKGQFKGLFIACTFNEKHEANAFQSCLSQVNDSIELLGLIEASKHLISESLHEQS